MALFARRLAQASESVAGTSLAYESILLNQCARKGFRCHKARLQKVAVLRVQFSSYLRQVADELLQAADQHEAIDYQD